MARNCQVCKNCHFDMSNFTNWWIFVEFVLRKWLFLLKSSLSRGYFQEFSKFQLLQNVSISRKNERLRIFGHFLLNFAWFYHISQFYLIFSFCILGKWIFLVKLFIPLACLIAHRVQVSEIQGWSKTLSRYLLTVFWEKNF